MYDITLEKVRFAGWVVGSGAISIDLLEDNISFDSQSLDLSHIKVWAMIPAGKKATIKLKANLWIILILDIVKICFRNSGRFLTDDSARVFIYLSSV